MNIMKCLKHILLPLVAVLFLLLVSYNASEHNLDVSSNKISTPEFGVEENEFLKTHDTIKVYVDPSIQYLTGQGEEGYINDYVNAVFDVADVKAQIVTDYNEKETCDCVLQPVTDKLRKDEVDKKYTMPIMQLEGVMYVREGLSKQDKGKGVVVEDRINSDKMNQLAYDSYVFDKNVVKSNKFAVEYALKNNSNVDYIVGDKEAILYYLDGNNEFVYKDRILYKLNVSFVFYGEEVPFYNITNLCVNSIDRHALSYEKSVKWANGNAPIFERTKYLNVYIIFIIVILSVIIAFLLYYAANKNLYVELENRMSKLIASRKELQTTFNGISYFLAELTRDGVIIDVNKAFYEYLNINPANKNIVDVIHLNDETHVKMQEMLEAASQGKVLEGFEVNFNRRVFLIEVFPVEGSSGEIQKLLFMCSDVTKEKMAEKQMIQDNKMIAVGQLASGVAHEIRNPLGIIRNYCYVLKTMKDENVQATAIERIEQAVETSGAIIENLLDFSRASSMKIDTVNVHEHILSMIRLNESLLKKKDINVNVECENEFNATLVVESFDMILINLISNAIDAMEPQGEINIAVTDNENYGLFRVDVSDNGSGIDPETLSEIFNPFFTTKIDSGGTGLGLYIVYNEIEKMNGTISVESKLGEGTTFKIVLPINVTE